MRASLQDALMTPAEVAGRLGVSPITVRSWVQKGWLKAQTTPGGHSRFHWRDVESLIKSRNLDPLTETRQILIVDDEAPFSRYLEHAIRLLSPDCDVAIAEDGFEAGLMLAELLPDIVLVDYNMPGMTGYAVCRIVKNSPKFSATQVVAITAMEVDDVRDKMLAAGANEVLYKPVDMQQLKQILSSPEASCVGTRAE